MSSLTIRERKSKFNKLSNSLNIKLIKGDEKDIQYMIDYINKGKNLKTKSIDSSNKNKCVAYRGELPFRILFYCRYIDLEKLKIVSCKKEKDEYRLLGIKSKKKKNGYYFKVIENAFIYRVFKKFGLCFFSSDII